MNLRFAALLDHAGKAVLIAAAFLLPIAFYLETFDPALVKDVTLSSAAVLAAAAWIALQIETGRVEIPVSRAPLAALTAAAVVWALFSYAAGDPAGAPCLSATRSVSFLLLFGAVLLGPASVSFADALTGALCAAGALGAFADFLPALGAAHRSQWAVLAAASVPLALARWADPESSTVKRGAFAACAVGSLWTVCRSGEPDALAALAAGGFALAATAASMLPDPRIRVAGLAAFAAAPAALWAFLSNPAPDDAALLAWWTRGQSAREAAVAAWNVRPWTGSGLATVADAAGGEPFTTAAETGGFGLALWGLLTAAVLILSWREIRRRSDAGEYRAAGLIAGQRSAFAALITAGLLGGATRAPAAGAAFWLLAASVVGLSTERGAARVFVFPIPAPAALRRVLLLPLTAAVALFFSWNAGQWQSDLSLNRGVFQYRRGEKEAALLHLAQVFDSYRESARARFLSGEIHRGDGAPEAALAFYKEAQRLDSKHPKAGERAGLMLAKLGRYAEAETELTAFLATRPDAANAYEILIDVEQNLGREELARDAALQLVRLDPDQSRYWRLLAEQYHGLHRTLTARRLFDKASQVGELAKLQTKTPRG